MFEKNRLVGLMSVVLLCAVFIVTALFSSCNDNDGKENVSNDHDGDAVVKDSKEEKETADFTVVVDAGHGGVDPGKIGIDGQLEKDINLQIALKLKEILESNEDINIKVILTRTEDMGHYSESDSNKKMADMKKRCEIVNNADADVLISIHQNSYHSSSVKGAQVFYYEGSERGHELATTIQTKLVEALAENEKGRVEKANDNYYILLNVSCPAVIVECGFLSNPDEAAKLCDEEYQKLVAETVGKGVIEFLEK